MKIIYTEEFETLSEARKREIEVKKMRKEEKEALTSKEGTESKESKDRL